MSAPARRSATNASCEACARRSRLLADLGPTLDFVARRRERLFATLALGDEQLIDALAGRRRAEVRARHAQPFAPSARGRRETAVCRHDGRYPAILSSLSAPPLLHVAGGLERLRQLTAAPAVAIVGATKASDYGAVSAHELARGLAGAGVSVAALLADGIGAAALRGALDGGGSAVGVAGRGLAIASAGRHRALLERLAAHGCALSELPRECGGRRWGPAASERIAVALASVVVLVEARDIDRELAGANLAAALGRALAATPGRIDSPLAAGPHAVLRGGGALVERAEDVLELLQASGADMRAWQREGAPVPALRPALRLILDRVGAGCATPDALAGLGLAPGEVLLALTELELMGLLVRGENGRYLRTAAPRRRAPANGLAAAARGGRGERDVAPHAAAESQESPKR